MIMSQVLTKSAQSVQDALEQKGLICNVIEMPSSTRTAIDAATAIGRNISQIVKSLIFKTKDSHFYIRNYMVICGANSI